MKSVLFLFHVNHPVPWFLGWLFPVLQGKISVVECRPIFLPAVQALLEAFYRLIPRLFFVSGHGVSKDCTRPFQLFVSLFHMAEHLMYNNGFNFTFESETSNVSRQETTQLLNNFFRS